MLLKCEKQTKLRNQEKNLSVVAMFFFFVVRGHW